MNLGILLDVYFHCTGQARRHDGHVGLILEQSIVHGDVDGGPEHVRGDLVFIKRLPRAPDLAPA